MVGVGKCLFTNIKPQTMATEKQASPKTEEIHQPKICGIDLPNDAVERLIKDGYPFYAGSFGPTLKIPNRQKGDGPLLLLGHDVPENFHEYDIIIVDLTNELIEDYKKENHTVPLSAPPISGHKN
jgi:hypothetical protein